MHAGRGSSRSSRKLSVQPDGNSFEWSVVETCELELGWIQQALE